MGLLSPENGCLSVRTWNNLNTRALFAVKEAHFVDGHRHRIDVGRFRRAIHFGTEPFRIQPFRRGPAQCVVTSAGSGSGDANGCRIGSDPRETNVRKTSGTVIRDEDVSLHQGKRRCSRMGARTALLSGRRGRALYHGGIQDHARRPPTVTRFNEGMDKTERSTCQFQGIGLWVFPQELDDITVFHPRRYEGMLHAIHRHPN